MRKRWLLLLAAAVVAVSASLVDATVSAARTADVPTTNVYAWIGLKNSDDVGTSFDLRAVVNGSSTGYLYNFSGGSSGFNNAHLAQIPVSFSGAVVSVTISARVACESRHTSGTARLWWNDLAANSRVETDGFGTRYLTGTNTLGLTAGPGPKKTSDVLVKKSGCPGEQPGSNWKSFGTWTVPSCTGGSEDFSTDLENSKPATFSGGTIDTAYEPEGGVRVQGSSWNGAFANGTHVLFMGTETPLVRLSFTSAVESVQLDVQTTAIGTHQLTLTAYNAANTAVGSDSLTQLGVSHLSVITGINNIAYFKVSTDIVYGFAFSNIAWGCTT